MTFFTLARWQVLAACALAALLSACGGGGGLALGLFLWFDKAALFLEIVEMVRSGKIGYARPLAPHAPRREIADDAHRLRARGRLRGGSRRRAR